MISTLSLEHSPVGRPRRDDAGNVEQRLLDAAAILFLEKGFEATSCEQIAALAKAGKASLYARYPNKESIFAAMIRRNVERTLVPARQVDLRLPLEERLRDVGLLILEHALDSDTVAMMRLLIATAPRFPDLARLADRMGWEGGVQCVVAAIQGGMDFDVDQAAAVERIAKRFVEFIFAPHQMRALLGDSPAELRGAAPLRVEQAIAAIATELAMITDVALDLANAPAAAR